MPERENRPSSATGPVPQACSDVPLGYRPASTATLFEDRQAIRRLLPTVDFEQVATRFVADVIVRLVPSHWDARARVFDAARPRGGDFHGHATAAELAERDRGLAEDAELCRRHAALLRSQLDADAGEAAELLLGEVA